jgi:mono/diheme cytochrome c family protein
MKIKLSILSLLCLALAFGMVSCEGDTGPAGSVGQVGPQGPAGPEGPEGAGFQDCAACHQSQNIAAKVFQWEHSTHATGGNFERNQASCAACHTSQGFLDRIATGAMSASMDVEDPLPQNCYTCHQIHSTFTEDDWAFTASDPVTFWASGETVDVGKSNLCINCHQARVESPALPDPTSSEMFTVTNKRYGPHHGAQGMMFTGSGAYRVGTGYTNSAHTNLIDNACVTCHMASAQGVESGGHTFNVSNEDGDINTASCVQCHTDAGELETLIEDTQTDIAALLDELQTALIDKGILNPNDLPYANASGGNPLQLTANELGALYNFQYVREDQSLGIHNYKFAKKLLENSIAAIN